MSFSWGEPTIRDFSKSREGRLYLGTLFDFEALPPPILDICPTNKEVNKAVLGRALELALQLVIQRQNRNFDFEISFERGKPDFRTKKGRESKYYLDSGELTGTLLSRVIDLANKQQKSFLVERSRSKFRATDALKEELQRVHDVASKLDWSIKKLFFQGRISSGFVAANADLILDRCLIETKTTQDAKRHSEHLSQLFTYYLLSQAPVRRSRSFEIDQVGIYYARHGVLIKESVSNLATFPMERIKRVAFDFMLEFSRWKRRKIGNADEDLTERSAIIEALREVDPPPEWARTALANPYKEVRTRQSSYVTPRKIQLPSNFLLGNNP